uniref:centromere protein W n=1 Tax=Myxine glutinosa TaxID=7769 RepID=UPI00358ED9A6
MRNLKSLNQKAMKKFKPHLHLGKHTTSLMQLACFLFLKSLMEESQLQVFETKSQSMREHHVAHSWKIALKKSKG